VNISGMRRRLCLWTLLILIGAALVAALVGPLHRHAASKARAALSLVKAAMDSGNVRAKSRGHYSNIVFLHHSVGRELIRQGRLRDRLADAGFDFYDHDYNSPGFTRPDGHPSGYSYNLPDDDTDPDALLRVFQQRVCRLPLNALSGLLQHEVIIVKSCFTSIRVLSADDLERQKAEYLEVSDLMAKHPDKLFIIMTSPPANPAETDAGSASRARLLADFLRSGQFSKRRANLRVFDFFGLLAESNPDAPDYNMLRQTYRYRADSHPNQVANEVIGPILAEFIIEAVRDYREQE
jgi:hypothetical protein